jgi:hypothetical protein
VSGSLLCRAVRCDGLTHAELTAGQDIAVLRPRHCHATLAALHVPTECVSAGGSYRWLEPLE